ncbi:hypothetical protein HUZ36_05205 [Pseudoalteromonas sp. McH1-7]|uniref:hypothetical protein n=1 Tax=Pseudoalteromonas sp. McH1-7 TaxID=2745574 RepID=UPI0015925F1A|nr:hypothetical protein [Pseudoalteromonas sp. McH1-7]NUZ10172.1 hypothetical protein [Pseudoalteromonas sp. McH1-7]
MEIIIKETSAIETLSIIDPATGCCYIQDFIGNEDGLGSESHQFHYDDESGKYVCSQETFDWWSKVVNDNQALNYRIAELCEIHDAVDVYEVVNSNPSNDLEDLAYHVNACLDQAFGEEQ